MIMDNLPAVRLRCGTFQHMQAGRRRDGRLDALAAWPLRQWPLRPLGLPPTGRAPPLPQATRMISELPDGKTVTMYDRGYRLGFMGAKEFPGTVPGRPYLNTHLRFIIKYHKDEKFDGARIVGFEVEAFSVFHKCARSAARLAVPQT
jgi:hypothetical protein